MTASEASRERGEVALLLPSLAGGGAERVFLEVARGLDRSRFGVTIVCVEAEGPLLGAIPDGVELVDLGCSRTAFAGRRLWRYLERRRPVAVVSALDPTNALNVLVAGLARPAVATVVTQHNTVSRVRANGSAKERAVVTAHRWTFARASRIVAVSDGVADDMAVALHLDRDRIDVIYNPVISDVRPPARSDDTPHPWLRDRTGPLLLAVGRLEPAKDFGTLVRAFALLPDDYRLIILGEGGRRDEIVGLAHVAGVADRIDVHGFVVDPAPFFAGADVFVLSSIWEGLPTVLIEALPYDCGIVATDCPSGPREILDGGRWGRLVPCADPAALAAAIAAEAVRPHVRTPEAWSRFEVAHAAEQYARLVDEVATASVLSVPGPQPGPPPRR